MIYFLLLDRKERYPSQEDQNLPPRNEIGEAWKENISVDKESDDRRIITEEKSTAGEENQYVWKILLCDWNLLHRQTSGYRQE